MADSTTLLRLHRLCKTQEETIRLQREHIDKLKKQIKQNEEVIYGLMLDIVELQEGTYDEG